MTTYRNVVVITDSESGVGIALINKFLQHNYNVVGCFTSQDSVHKILPKIYECALFTPFVGNIEKSDTAKNLFQKAIIEYGHVNILIHNSGGFSSKPFEQTSELELSKLIDNNIYSFYYLSLCAIKNMIKNNGGHIIAITSSLALQPSKKIPAALSVLVKGGIHAMIRALSLEFSHKNIRVNGVAPGFVETQSCKVDDQAIADLVSPSGRLGTVEDIIEAVKFLITSDYISGAILPVDGGHSSGQW